MNARPDLKAQNSTRGLVDLHVSQRQVIENNIRDSKKHVQKGKAGPRNKAEPEPAEDEESEDKEEDEESDDNDATPEGEAPGRVIFLDSDESGPPEEEDGGEDEDVEEESDSDDDDGQQQDAVSVESDEDTPPDFK